MKLAGGTVLITGASQGLGAATARAIAARGAEVVLFTRGEDKPRDVSAKPEVAPGLWRNGFVTTASRSVKLRARLARSGVA